MTRGFLCAKVTKYLDRVYSPDRVLYPMRRTAAKGPVAGDPLKNFQRISWDEALDEIAARFRIISEECGPEAILPYSYAGTTGTLGFGSMDRRFFHRLGASQLNRTICASAGGDALLTVYGEKAGTEPEQFSHSRTIIAWGANILGTNVHLWPFIEEARQKGGRLVVIDPYQTRTARAADWYIPINPGTDVALALGMMHVIIGENLYDADYVAKYTEGFEELRSRALEYPPQMVSQITGVPADDIVRLAREYASARPAVIRVNYGVQRAENGGMAVRAIAMLPCITGSWKEVGGGLQLSTSGAFKLNEAALERPELMYASPLGRAARVVNMSQLGEALTKLDGPPVQAVFVYNCNPLAIAPNQADVIRGFLRPDLFTVVHELFFTDSTDYADLVLPATTFFEHKELQKAYGHYFLQMSDQAIAPLGECRSNPEVFQQLALRMGFTEDCFRDSVDDLIDQALDTENQRVKGITRAQLEREGSVRLQIGEQPFLPYQLGNFKTPSGKARLYNSDLIAQGLDPVACFVAPVESRHSGRAKKYPLEFLGRKADNYLNSSFANLPSIQKMEEPALLEISTADAASRGIADGDGVRIFNDRGEIDLVAKVDGVVRPGVVAAVLNWAKLSARGKNVNMLTSERLTDIGAGATFYSCLVEVEAIAKKSSVSPLPSS